MHALVNADVVIENCKVGGLVKCDSTQRRCRRTIN